ncbi:hypothetical protein BS50DRAFT_509956, partial [Corynespora cassiicola Philippines]
AWVIVGVALRLAYSLGLHVRNEDPSATDAKREMLVHIWWGLHSLECLLSAVTGRPSIIVYSRCSVPLPEPLSKEQSLTGVDAAEAYKCTSMPSASSPLVASMALSPSPKSDRSFSLSHNGKDESASESYFKAVARIGVIMQDILSSLYTPGTMVLSSDEIEGSISHFGQLLDHWIASLPPQFNFQDHGLRTSNKSQAFFRQRLLLGFHFYSTKILMTRPCLGGHDISTGEGDEKETSRPFVHRTAIACIESAKAIADLLPDQPNPLLLYEYGPWWSVFHPLMQAFSIFLLGFSSFSCISHDRNLLIRYASKLLRWIRSMEDPLSARVYQVALRTYGAIVGGDIPDI